VSSRRVAAVIALLLVATAWGATFTLIKDVLGRIAPEPFIFWRFTIAGLVLCALFYTASTFLVLLGLAQKALGRS